MRSDQELVLNQAMTSGNYPEIAQLPEDAFSIDGKEALEFGLKPLLDGRPRAATARGERVAQALGDRTVRCCCRSGVKAGCPIMRVCARLDVVAP